MSLARYSLTGRARTSLDGWREWQAVRDGGRVIWLRKSRLRELRRAGRIRDTLARD
jgi:hypothetical protein